MLHSLLLSLFGLFALSHPAPVGDSSGATGLVLDSRGQPLSGAEVFIADLRSTHDWCIESEAAGNSQDRPVRSDITDSEGRFDLGNLEAGRARLSIRAEGHGTLRRERIFLEARGVTELGPYQLSRGAQLKGIVTDRQGLPVKEARVFSFPDRARSRGLGIPTAALETETDLRGQFELGSLPLGEWTLLITADGFAPQRFEGALTTFEHQGAAIPFRLTHSAAIRGRVTTLTSVRNLSNLLVRAIPVEEFDLEGPSPSFAQGYVTASVDRTGTFEVGPLRENTLYLLRAQEEDQPFTTEDAWSPTALVMSGSAEARLEWLPSCKVSYRAFEVANGQAPERVTLELPGTSHAKPFARQHEKKLNTLENVRPLNSSAAFTFLAGGNGYRPFQSQQLELVPGQTIKVGDVALWEQPTVTLKVIDSETKLPIHRARVVLKETEAIPAPRQVAKGVTDEGGVLTINQFPGSPLALGVIADDHAPQIFQSPFELVDGVLRVELDPGLDLGVSVHNSDGDPVIGEGVRGQLGKRFEQYLFEGTEDATQVHHTDEDGIAWFHGLASLEYTFELTHWDPNASTSLPQSVTPVPGPIGQIRFGLDARTTLEGKVLEGGLPLNSAEFRLDGLRVRTNETGEFRLDDVRPGPHTWVVTHPGRVMSHSDSIFLDVSKNLFEFVLPATTLEGAVVDALSAPVEGATLHMSESRWQEGFDLEALRGKNLFRAARASRAPVLALSDKDGFFSLNGVREMLGLTLSARTADGFVGLQRVRDIRAGSVVSGIQLRLQVPSSLFIPALNEPIRSKSLLALVATFHGEAQAGTWMRVLAPYTGQSWRLAGLPSGTWEIAMVGLSDFGDIVDAQRIGRVKLEPGEEFEFALDR